MPIPKTWVEELACEWLQLSGYLVIPNVRLISGKRGGTKEADLIGIRVTQKDDGYRDVKIVLEIIHIETGSLSQSFEKNLSLIKKKFDKQRVETVKKLVSNMIKLKHSRLEFFETIYRKIYIVTYIPRRQVKRLKDELARDNIEIWTLRDFLFKVVVNTIDEWKNRQVKMGIRRTRGITLPENMWLLSLIDFIKNNIETKDLT